MEATCRSEQAIQNSDTLELGLEVAETRSERSPIARADHMT